MMDKFIKPLLVYGHKVKINQFVKFKYNGRLMFGKVVTIGLRHDVNVISNNKYYYCYNYKVGIYLSSSIINFSDISTK